ncbi:MAG TPA: Gmad2 immunoglobulin-like domain-containing protein, partial [Nocardioides sp.]
MIALALCGVLAAGCGSNDAVAEDPDVSAEPSEEPSTLPRTSGLITLAAPAEGATVSDSFEASGKANSNEANVPWEVR